MAKTDFLTADMTRRQFMKISGKSLAGLSLSASMLSLFGCSQSQIDSGAVATWALPQGLLVVNADLCTGCQRCEINCTLTNDGVCSSYISRVKIQRRLNLGIVLRFQLVVVDGGGGFLVYRHGHVRRDSHSRQADALGGKILAHGETHRGAVTQAHGVLKIPLAAGFLSHHVGNAVLA